MMKIIKSVLKPKKKPTVETDNKLNILKIEKDEFDIEKTPKSIIKRSRDVSLIEPEVKRESTPVKKNTVIKPIEVKAKPAEVKVKPAEIKTEITRVTTRSKTKADSAAKPGEIKTVVVVKPTEVKAKTIVKPSEVKTKAIAKTKSTNTEDVKADSGVKEQTKTPVVTTRKSSRLSSPAKTDLKVTKVTKGRSARPVGAKIDRNSLMMNVSSDEAAAADESFEVSEISEEADEFEMIEISENEEVEEITNVPSSDSELQRKKKRQTQKRKGSAKSKKPMLTKKKDASRWERIKKVLESGGTVEALPGRVDEFDWIKRTVTGLLESSLGGCLYISGVPGTGKTATTHRTLDALSLAALKGECCDFDFVEINGMRLSDPGQAYSILAKTIFKGQQKRVPSSGAVSLQKLENHFKAQQKSKTPGRPCVVLLDELDLLLRKKQSILYHFFEWPNWANSQLIVITIANTMDLPERFLSNRISSRLGLTRYNFKPYDHAALANIIEHQLKDYVQYLGKDAIQLCARKVSAVSGDARRAVNLAKRAVDYFRSCTQEELVARMTGRIVEKVAEGSEMTAVNLRLMDIILKDALMANPVEVIGQLAKHQRILLLSIVLARKRCEEESSLKGGTKIIGSAKSSAVLTINRVLEQHFQLCRTHQYHPLPSLQELHCLLESLESLRLLRCVKFRESGPEGVVQLLVHEEDIRKGLGDDQALKKYIRD